VMVYVMSDSDPGNGFQPQQATLEDLYFSNI